ncbi:unnamed protein product [Camellia sinensis]
MGNRQIQRQRSLPKLALDHNSYSGGTTEEDLFSCELWSSSSRRVTGTPIKNVRRNKMTPKRAEDLIFIHNNLRLLSRRTPQYMQGQTKTWDIAGDAFDSFEDVGEIEIATLSLDEPELEAIVFTDDGDGGDGSDDEAIEVESNDR